MEGRVEVCTLYSRWGTVCNNQWTPSHTKVVCRQLGYSDIEGTAMLKRNCGTYRYTGSYEGSHTFGEAIGPILMDYVNCTGSELRLWDCVYFTHSYSGCDHVGVRCQPGSIIILCTCMYCWAGNFHAIGLYSAL